MTGGKFPFAFAGPFWVQDNPKKDLERMVMRNTNWSKLASV